MIYQVVEGNELFKFYLWTAFKRYWRLKIWLYYWPKIVPSVVSFIILIFLIISYFWFYIWRLNIKHCHQKSLVWWKKCEIPINYLIFLHFLGEKIAFTSNATYILLYLTSRSTVHLLNYDLYKLLTT